ncbi:MAG: hypothetical protein RBT41_06185 [Clostridia bacterium]|jgi:hypothetical protein|nr:hypothetical protein [Clostridia bacterium]
MMTVLAGLTAAALAWCGNLLLVRRWGDICVVWVVPAFEEFVKSGTALLFGASIIFVHMIFGLAEAAHDYYASRRFGFWSALTALISHTVFGLVTYYILLYSGMWFLAIAGAALVHTAVNYLSIHYLRARKERR